LGIEVVLQCFAEKHVESHGGCVYIFCDCQKAIDVLTQHNELIKHPGVFVKVKHLGELLKAKLCIDRLVKIQGHTGIADMLIAPNSSGFVAKHENCTLKEVLFQFLATIDRKM